MNLRVNRRRFLHVAGGGALGLATSGVTVRGLSTMNAVIAGEEIAVPGGPEARSLSVCSQCPGGCGLRVRTIGKRAVKIEGNPLHPVNHGGLCPRGVAGLQPLYHPDRLRAPQKNVGTRGDPRWKQISWEEGIEIAAQRLGELSRRQESRTAVFVAGRYGYLQNRLFQRFMEAFGSPNFFCPLSGLDAAQMAAYLQQGVGEGLAYDLDETRYLLSFGVNLLEGWGSPVSNMRAFGRWRDSSGGRRTKFVQVEPRFSPTAARADEWVPLRPGTEAALALGLAYVLITEGLYDARFVSERTFGFDDWRDPSGRSHLGFRSLVLREYRLNEVAALTQIPAETILRLGREFGRNRPALAIGGSQCSILPGDLYTAMAVNSLNAMMGSLEVPGGVLVRPQLPVEREATDRRGKPRTPSVLSSPDTLLPLADLTLLPDVILKGRPHSIQAVFVHGVDPVFSLPNGEQFGQALKQVPFVVSFSSFLDETAAYADLILPDHTDLEKWQEAGSPPTFPRMLVSISPPVVEPVHDTRATTDVMLQIAHSLGGEPAAALPHRNFEEFLRAQVEELFANQAGYVFTSGLEETWNRLLERSGWWAPTYSTAKDLWQQIKERGGWWEPTYFFGEWDRVLQTSSRRFEFYSQKLAQWMADHKDRATASGSASADDRLCLPHQPRLPEPPAEFPLLLLPIEVLPLAGANGAHLPYLQQITGPHVFEFWESWLEINPTTARQLGLADRDWVWVESKRGRVRVRLRLYAGVRPGVVHLPLGYGSSQGSSWGRRGVNPLSLVELKREPLTGRLQTSNTWVRVYRS